MKTIQNPKTTKAAGRPRKFDEVSRPVTLTLPESTLRALRHVHPDRGRAIVKLTEAAVPKEPSDRPLVEIVEIGPHRGLLIIGPSDTLREIPFLHLIEIGSGRYLLALDAGHTFESLELAINDVLDEVADDETWERELIAQLLTKIKRLRKSGRLSMANILFAETERNPASKRLLQPV